MALNLAFLPAAVAGVIQNGILEQKLLDAMRPALLWRGLSARERHMGRIGETVTKTRDGLIAPDTEASARIVAGGDPGTVTRSVEQFSYQIAPYGKSTLIDLPTSFLAQANRFIADTRALGFHAAQTMGRIVRGRFLAAYGGGTSFALLAGAATTSVRVKDCTGFDSVMVNGAPQPTSVANPLPVHVSGSGAPGSGTAAQVTACVPDVASSPASGPGTLTLAVALSFAQYDAVVRDDAARIFRQGSRATDRLIVASDTPTIATFRAAAASLRADNVPGIDGQIDSPYACFVDPQVEAALLADPEFHDAIKAVGLTGPFADGAIGDYAGIRFVRNNEMASFATDTEYQARIYRSFMSGAEAIVEAYIPESDFASQVVPEGIASSNHYRMPLDADAVLSMIVRAPLDALGHRVMASWAANADWAVPTDSLNQTGPARVKRCRVIHTSGPQ